MDDPRVPSRARGSEAGASVAAADPATTTAEMKPDGVPIKRGSSEGPGYTVSDHLSFSDIYRAPYFNSDGGESLGDSSVMTEDVWNSAVSVDELIGGSGNSTSTFVDALAHRLFEEYRKLIIPPRMDERRIRVPSCGTHGATPQTTIELSSQPSRQTTLHQRHPGRDGNRGKRNLGQDSDDEEPQRPPSKKKRVKGPSPRRAAKQLACLFWKLDPSTHRECFRLTLKDTSRLKQHLNRKHAPEYYCECCLTVLPNEEAHREHIKPTVMACLPRTSSFPGITYQQRGQLSKKSDPRQSEIQRWYSMWKIVFPDQPPPASPYIDTELSEDMSRFMECAYAQGPVIMAAELMAALSQQNVPGATATALPEESTATLHQAVSRSLTLIFEEWLAKRESSRQSAGADHSESVTPESQPPVSLTDQPSSGSTSSQTHATPTAPVPGVPFLDSTIMNPGTVLPQERRAPEPFRLAQAGTLSCELQIPGEGDAPQSWGDDQDWSFLDVSIGVPRVMDMAASSGTGGFDMVGFEGGFDPVWCNIEGGEEQGTQ